MKKWELAVNGITMQKGLTIEEASVMAESLEGCFTNLSISCSNKAGGEVLFRNKSK